MQWLDCDMTFDIIHAIFVHEDRWDKVALILFIYEVQTAGHGACNGFESQRMHDVYLKYDASCFELKR